MAAGSSASISTSMLWASVNSGARCDAGTPMWTRSSGVTWELNGIVTYRKNDPAR